MNSMDFLLWVRGPAFQIAVVVFVLGISFRLLEIFLLGRRPDFAESRASGFGPGMATILRRSAPDPGTFRREPVTMVAGYFFHVGFFITLFLFAPHIELFRDWIGIRWPALPTPVVDAAAVVTIVTLIITLFTRIWDPVRRYISRFQDYLAWAVTLAPVLSGYLAYHRLALPYNNMLAIHILSVELLMVVFPFTKLMHMFTLFGARWYNGALAGRRGVAT